MSRRAETLVMGNRQRMGVTRVRRGMVRRVRGKLAAAIGALQALLAGALLITTSVIMDVDPPPSLILLALGLLGLAIVGALVLAQRAAQTVETLFAHQDHLMLAVAHEIGSPLSYAIAILDEGASEEVPIGTVLSEATASVVDLAELIEDLLATARILSGAIELPREEMRLDEIVRRLPGVGQVVGTELRFETSPRVMRGSPHLVRRAVSNLVRNAAAHGFSGPGGEIVVRVDDCGITVSDDGPGVSPAKLSKLRHGVDSLAVRPGRHKGLGLPLARWVASAHDGRLVLRNRPEGGFEAQLHVQSKPATAIAPPGCE